ncbi:hypothetical protein C9U36_22995 [Salmonella enterica subsp. enterica serovar Enteritidis]|uniref:DNA replication protein n=1 Tax=Salmonella enteritidis TaxID=149539 RepID=A0A731B2M2_SALEN|nr:MULTISPECIES: hypothetical protein [Salmonella]EDQ8458763.1 hypothetical protein [Salmonella enterica]EDN5567222.1 hypothetical protein [Salmonella enterica subsp. enterica serovar Enteritidis]EDN5567358.1 hypothetical protein [Salmonella enterica subsp. enterica serovar Enteritidis]EDO3198178.1 hypothetical protein [Salmonella enterica subsp. enterica serovar Enteritidis]EDO3198264.1 hypothetical protein [Salmonella enterica subsp. enterica serovar Enteritidis]
MGSCAAPSAKGDDKFITTDYLQQCQQDIFIFYIQWLIFLLIGNTMKNTMLRKGLTIF